MRFISVLFIFQFLFASQLFAEITIESLAREEIQVAPYSTVTADEPIRLGLIASPTKTGDSKFSEVEDIEILDAKSEGDRVFISRIELARKLQTQIEKHDFIFKIPNQIIIEPRKNFIPQYDVSRKIISESKKLCGNCDISIRDLQIPEIKSKAKMISWDIDMSQTRAAGSALIPLKAQMESGPGRTEQSTVWVQAKIQIERSALVARRNLKAGDRVEANDYEARKVNFTFEKESPLTESEIKGQALAKYVTAGQAFKAGDIKREPAAQRGQLLKVISGLSSSEDSAMEVSIQATAEENGFIGDVIRVKNTESQKILSGTVIEKGVVKIQ